MATSSLLAECPSCGRNGRRILSTREDRQSVIARKIRYCICVECGYRWHFSSPIQDVRKRTPSITATLRSDVDQSEKTDIVVSMIATYDQATERLIDERGETVAVTPVSTYVASMNGDEEANQRKMRRWIFGGRLPVPVSLPGRGRCFRDLELSEMIRRLPGRVPRDIAQFFLDENGGVRRRPQLPEGGPSHVDS